MNPDEGKQFVGCASSACSVLCYIREVRLKTSKLQSEPFTRSICDEYESTYEDVATSHAPECKCRPVECPLDITDENKYL